MFVPYVSISVYNIHLQEDEDDNLDSEEELSDDGTLDSDEGSILSASTLELGQAPKKTTKKKDTDNKGDKSKSKANKGSKDKDKIATTDKDSKKDSTSLREKQWAVIHAAQVRIRKANPDMPAKEVLQKARAECFSCTSNRYTVHQKNILLITVAWEKTSKTIQKESIEEHFTVVPAFLALGGQPTLSA